MDVSLPKKDLAHTLSILERVTYSNPDLPISKLRMVAENEALTIEASDITSLMRVVLPAEIARPGGVLAPTAIVSRIEAMPDAAVRLDVREDTAIDITTAASKRRYTIRGMPLGSWPADLMECPSDAPTVKVPTATLLVVLRSLRDAVGKDETKPGTNSICFRFHPTSTECIATNGHVLSKVSKILPGASGEALLLSRAHALVLTKLLDRAVVDQAEVELAVTDKLLLVRTGSFEYASLRVRADFPDYTPLVSSLRWGPKLTFERERIVDAIDAMRLVGDGVTLTLKSGESRLHMEASDPSTGKVEDAVECKVENGPSMGVVKTKLSPDYLKAAVAATTGSDVVVSLGAEKTASIVASVEGLAESVAETEQFTVIMPMAF